MNGWGKYIFVAAIWLSALCSCVRRPLDLVLEKGSAITVIAHWDSTGMRPAGMTVMCFPRGGGSPYVKISNSDTTSIFLSQGTYDILVFNETTTDLENVRFASMGSFEEIYAYTIQGGGSFYDNIREIPEKLASWTLRDVVVTEEMARHTFYYRRGTNPPDILPWEDMVIHAWPEIITCTIQLKVWIDHIDKVASAGGYLCHFSSGIRMTGGHPLAQDASYKVSFEDLVETGDRKGYFYKEFLGFGLYDGCFEPIEGYSFDFFAVLADGSGFRERKWVDNNITWYYGPYHELYIVVEVWPHIIIPDVRGNQGWNIGVDEWANEDIYVIL